MLKDSGLFRLRRQHRARVFRPNRRGGRGGLQPGPGGGHPRTAGLAGLSPLFRPFPEPSGPPFDPRLAPAKLKERIQENEDFPRTGQPRANAGLPRQVFCRRQPSRPGLPGRAANAVDQPDGPLDRSLRQNGRVLCGAPFVRPGSPGRPLVRQQTAPGFGADQGPESQSRPGPGLQPGGVPPHFRQGQGEARNRPGQRLALSPQNSATTFAKRATGGRPREHGRVL